ncbi:hypothetical protein Tsubulata_003946, partial [Turnera subulata]
MPRGQSPQTQTSTVDQVGAGDRNVAGGRGRGGGGGRGRGRGSGRGSGRGAGVTSNLEQPPHVGSEETQLNPQIGQQSRRKPPTVNPTRRTRSQSEISSSSMYQKAKSYYRKQQQWGSDKINKEEVK